MEALGITETGIQSRVLRERKTSQTRNNVIICQITTNVMIGDPETVNGLLLDVTC